MAEYIEREALLGVIDCELFKTDPNGAEQIGVLKCRRIAHTLPAADVAPVVHGEWLECSNELNKYCSVCKNIHGTIYDKPPFCENCGAKMDGERRESEC